MKSFFIDIESVCYKLGMDLEVRGSRLVGLCPIHGEDNPSFTIFKDTNSWYCFGCRRGGGPLQLVSSLVDEVRTWGDFVQWYASEEVLHKTPVRLIPSLDKVKGLLSSIEVTLPNADQSQNPFLSSLGILFASEGVLAGRHIIPVILHGKLVAYEARDFNGRLVPKTLALPQSVKIHSFLWNFDNIAAEFPVVVVEGIKDAIAVLNFGYTNVVSSFGSQLTSDQIVLLMLKSPPEVIIAYDADETGIVGAEKAALNLLAWTHVSRVKLPEGTDPWDVTKTTWERCFRDRKRVFVDDKNRKLVRGLKNKLFL